MTILQVDGLNHIGARQGSGLGTLLFLISYFAIYFVLLET